MEEIAILNIYMYIYINVFFRIFLKNRFLLK